MTKFLLHSFAVCLLLSAPMLNGESKNMADYTLRIRVFSKDATNFYYSRNVEESKGEGRGDLFENDNVIGVDFNFACDQKFKASFGYETYPARWKKPGQVLTVLLPVFGKANTYFTCNFNTALRDTVYKRNNGRMGEEPAARYKAWMVKHEYDPVHGKNTPVNLTAQDQAEESGAAPAPAATPAPQP
ncbi:MAG: hypothetical protein ACLQM6_01590 [Acidobacteriaceae bacterium]